MLNSINIGKYIYSKLSNCSAVTSVVGSRIYPIVAENNTPQPFIVYQKTGIYPISTSKDGYAEDRVNVQITVVCDSYSQSTDLAQKVRECLTTLRDNFEGSELYNIHMTAITESYDNVYVQTMTFETQVQ